ncbi:conserved hypothetical protein [Caldicellulosiruptor hydrothermalis 108]|uniref:Aerotolerance regulator N-terminal domain-containing protein n=1 Tax=Caldicellulosiruptor hydrothermalis (strain DSM 18901 / VKM B-2411 / 108) TaxID=632292 RepID=E4QCG5_CALH1|nr:BatA domain-containing protein [Caldicellulosiruptor hydrothermalis]ADQ06261.1 conserved hypothetical protein [Caldicellulosiruptor hydrothermalis 108]
MRFTQPLYLLFLLSIPVLVVLYMIRPKYKKVVISSTYLWERLKKQKRVSKPAQKLRLSLLLILGILTLAAFSLNLAGPYISITDTKKKVIFAFDVGSTMNCFTHDNKTYLEKSKEIARSILDTLPKGSKVSIVTFSDSIEVLAKDVSPSFAKSSIGKVLPTYYVTNLKESINVISKLFDASRYTLFLFTDKKVKLQDNIQVFEFPKLDDNVSIDNVSLSTFSDGFDAAVEVTNRGIKRASFEIELFADQKLVGAKSMMLLPKQSESVIFEKIKGNYKVVWARINYPDRLREDNIFWTILAPPPTKKKVLYVGKGNFFLEKAFSAFDDVELYKLQDVKNVADGFDIYVFDSVVPKRLPKKGGVIFILQKGKDVSQLLEVSIGNKKDIEGYARFVESTISQNIDGMEFAVQKAISIDDKKFEPVAKVNGKPVISFGVVKNLPTVLIGFAIDDSDLPLKVSFPILITNIKNNFVRGNQPFEKMTFYPGEEIKVFSYTDGKAEIILPNSKREVVNFSTYPLILPKNDRLGVYTLNLSNNTSYKFAVNYPTYALDESEEKKTDATLAFSETGAKTNAKVPYLLKDILLILSLIFLTFEWMVFMNENKS